MLTVYCTLFTVVYLTFKNPLIHQVGSFKETVQMFSLIFLHFHFLQSSVSSVLTFIMYIDLQRCPKMRFFTSFFP
jgi:hypothetical protein